MKRLLAVTAVTVALIAPLADALERVLAAEPMTWGAYVTAVEAFAMKTTLP